MKTGGLLTEQGAGRGGKLWTGRQVSEIHGERDGKKGHIEGEHWPGALLRALPSFSPFFRRLSERRNRHEMKRTKTHFLHGPMGTLEPVVPHIAAPI